MAWVNLVLNWLLSSLAKIHDCQILVPSRNPGGCFFLRNCITFCNINFIKKEGALTHIFSMSFLLRRILPPHRLKIQWVVINSLISCKLWKTLHDSTHPVIHQNISNNKGCFLNSSSQIQKRTSQHLMYKLHIKCASRPLKTQNSRSLQELHYERSPNVPQFRPHCLLTSSTSLLQWVFIAWLAPLGMLKKWGVLKTLLSLKNSRIYVFKTNITLLQQFYVRPLTKK